MYFENGTKLVVCSIFRKNMGNKLKKYSNVYSTRFPELAFMTFTYIANMSSHVVVYNNHPFPNFASEMRPSGCMCQVVLYSCFGAAVFD